MSYDDNDMCTIYECDNFTPFLYAQKFGFSVANCHMRLQINTKKHEWNSKRHVENEMEWLSQKNPIAEKKKRKNFPKYDLKHFPNILPHVNETE